MPFSRILKKNVPNNFYPKFCRGFGIIWNDSTQKVKKQPQDPPLFNPIGARKGLRICYAREGNNPLFSAWIFDWVENCQSQEFR